MISENDFEDSAPTPGQNEPVAIDNKHAYKKVVIKSLLSPSSKPDPSPSKGVSSIMPSESDVISEASPVDGLSNIGPSPSIIVVDRSLDKINNLAQKEISLSRVGVTREKAYRVIATALDARKWMDVVDRQGNVKQEYVDDLEKQRWGAEMAIKMFGDMIERKEIEYEVGDKTLDRLRSLSVAELKARAADLLLGRKGAVDAEVSRVA